jgi:hypothetical protein
MTILAITYQEKNLQTGLMEILVSHGFDTDTGRTIILPQDTPEKLGAVFNKELGQYVLNPNKC